LPDLVIEPHHLLRLYIQDLTEVLIDIQADEVVRRSVILNVYHIDW